MERDVRTFAFTEEIEISVRVECDPGGAGRNDAAAFIGLTRVGDERNTVRVFVIRKNVDLYRRVLIRLRAVINGDRGVVDAVHRQFQRLRDRSAITVANGEGDSVEGLILSRQIVQISSDQISQPAIRPDRQLSAGGEVQRERRSVHLRAIDLGDEQNVALIDVIRVRAAQQLRRRDDDIGVLIRRLGEIRRGRTVIGAFDRDGHSRRIDQKLTFKNAVDESLGRRIADAQKIKIVKLIAV